MNSFAAKSGGIFSPAFDQAIGFYNARNLYAKVPIEWISKPTHVFIPENYKLNAENIF